MLLAFIFKVIAGCLTDVIPSSSVIISPEQPSVVFVDSSGFSESVVGTSWHVKVEAARGSLRPGPEKFRAEGNEQDQLAHLSHGWLSLTFS